jgi:hypothetical protein
MSYYYIEPEVSGGIGKGTILDTKVHPPLVSELTYEFDTFPLDAILSGFPAYIVTERLKESLLRNGATGIDFAQMNIATSANFDTLKLQYHADKDVPLFAWLKVDGKAGIDDFGIARDNRLVVSERVLRLFEEQGIENALVEAYKG